MLIFTKTLLFAYLLFLIVFIIHHCVIESLAFFLLVCSNMSLNSIEITSVYLARCYFSLNGYLAFCIFTFPCQNLKKKKKKNLYSSLVILMWVWFISHVSLEGHCWWEAHNGFSNLNNFIFPPLILPIANITNFLQEHSW